MEASKLLGKPPGKEQAETTPYTPAERLEIIKVNIGSSYKELAKLCKCSYSTLFNDMAKWRKQGGFEDWLQEEFFDLHTIVRNESPEIAYKIVAGLLGKLTAKKIEAGISLDIGPRFSALMRETFGIELESESAIEAEFSEIGESAGEIVKA